MILAAGSEGYRLALDLLEAGVEVVALADLRDEGEAGPWGEAVTASGIMIYKGHTIYEAIASRDKNSLAGVVLCPLDETGGPQSIGRVKLACDGVLMSVGWTPVSGIAYQAGVRFRHDARVEQLVPDSLPERVFVAGRAAGIFELADQLADGNRAGLAAATACGQFSGQVPPPLTHTGPPPSHPYPIVPHPGKKNFVDLDEDLHLVDFQNAHQEGL